LDAITLLLYLFFGFILLIVIFIGGVILLAIFRALFGKHPASENQTDSRITKEPEVVQENEQDKEDSREDSEGDGLMLFDDPMFPPEFDDEDDDQ
jgi:hypothetical protein